MSAFRNPVSISADSAHYSSSYLLAPAPWNATLCNVLQNPIATDILAGTLSSLPHPSPKASHASLCNTPALSATDNGQRTTDNGPSTEQTHQKRNKPNQNRTGATENDDFPHARTHSF
jgi:hypothetical protein